MIDETNPYAKNYRREADHISQDRSTDLKLQLIGKETKNGREYNISTTYEVVALIVDDFESMPDKRDIIVKTTCGQF